MNAATDYEQQVMAKVAAASAGGDPDATAWLRGYGGVRLGTGPGGEPTFTFTAWADYPTDALLREAQRLGFGLRPDGAGGLRLVSPPDRPFDTPRDRARRRGVGAELTRRPDVRAALKRIADRRRERGE